MSENDRLPVPQRIAFGTGHVLNIMAVVGMWYPYSVTYFEKVLGLSSGSTATILLVSQVVGAVVTPFIGIWSDSCYCSYGRRKIFHLVGLICVVCSFFFIWHRCIHCDKLDESYLILYYSSFAIVFQFGWACTQISQLALVPELTSDKATKVELNSIRYGVQVVSAMFVFIMMWILLATLGDGLVDSQKFGPKTEKTFWVLAVIVIVVGLILTLPFQIFLREKKNVTVKKLKWYKWLKNPHFYLAICTFVVSKLITVIPMTYIPLYFIEFLEMNKTSIAIGPLVLFVVSCILTPFVKYINKYIGMKLLYTLGIFVVFVAMAWFWLHGADIDDHSSFNFRRDDIYLAVILFGVGGTTISVVALTFLSSLVGEYSGSGAFVYGWAFFGDRFSNGIVNNIILRVHHTSTKPITFYRDVIVYVTLVSSLLGLLAVVWMKMVEMWQSRNAPRALMIRSEEANSDDRYGAIQNDGGSTVPLLKSTETVANGVLLKSTEAVANGIVIEEKRNDSNEQTQQQQQQQDATQETVNLT